MLFDDCGVENNASWRLPPELPAANKLTIGIMALIAQNEREAISAPTRAALAARKTRGLPLGNPANLTPTAAALGSAAGNVVTFAKADKRAADIAPVIADIQAMGAVTCAAIAAELNARGFPAPSGSTCMRGPTSATLHWCNGPQ